MDRQQERLQYLLSQHTSRTLNANEEEELSDLLQRLWERDIRQNPSGEPDWEKMVTEIVSLDNAGDVRRLGHRKNFFFRYAAAILLLCVAGAYFFFNAEDETVRHVAEVNVELEKGDVLPGSDKAILILSSGDQVALNALGKETIMDGDVAINNNQGELVYNNSDVVVENTVKTPHGGQYKLSLPDGSKAWLNAASSVRFPTAFPGKQREVTITGEVYFEVAHNASRPFIIHTIRDKVTVLGTELNLNYYPDEPHGKVSLLTGSVKVADQILKPGEAFFEGKVVSTNLERDVAWKNGVFNFEKTRIDAVMRQLSRWYDIDVEYPEGIPELIISGSIGMDLNLSQTLAGLKVLGLHAIQQNRKVIVKN